jgi:hypothetical protein
MLKEEIFILAYSFRGFNPWSIGSVVSGTAVVRQSIMVRRLEETKLLTSW